MVDKTRIIEYVRLIERMCEVDYQAFIIALAQNEGVVLDEKEFKDWYNSDYPLLDDSLNAGKY